MLLDKGAVPLRCTNCQSISCVDCFSKNKTCQKCGSSKLDFFVPGYMGTGVVMAGMDPSTGHITLAVPGSATARSAAEQHTNLPARPANRPRWMRWSAVAAVLFCLFLGWLWLSSPGGSSPTVPGTQTPVTQEPDGPRTGGSLLGVLESRESSVVRPPPEQTVENPAQTRVVAKVEADIADVPIYPGEDFTYFIIVEGGGKPSKIDITPLAAFNPRQASISKQSIQVVSGRTTTSFGQDFAITAGPPGVMHLPAVTVVVDGRTYTTNPVDVTISRPGTADRMSVECQISDKKCYVGQPLVMTVRWIVTARVKQGAFDVPVFKSNDFYVEDVSESSSANIAAGKQTVIDSVPVAVTEERQVMRGMEGTILSFRNVLIPKRAGRIRLDPLTVSADMAVGRERTNDDFFNPYRVRYQRVSVQSEPLELEVRPLPETGKPPEFYGLVGRYTIAATASPTQVNVGDPITLTIRVGGNPFLKPVQWPVLEQVPGLATNFKILTEKASPFLEAGTKVFTQTLRANSDKVTQIPAIPLAFFDPDKGGYVVAKTDPIKISVCVVP